MHIRRRRQSSSVAADSSQSIWKAFGIIFLLSTVLSVFILFRQRQWQGDHQRAVLVVHSVGDEVRQPLSLVIVKPENKIQVLPLPPDQIVETPLDYGGYATDALVGLTQLENLRWEYLTYAVSLEYGVAIDGIVWSKEPDLKNLSQVRKLAFLALINRQPSTIVFWDRFKWWVWLQRVPSYQFESVDVAQYVDGNRRLDQARYDRWAELYLQDSAIRGSDYSLIVQNGTGVDGYAHRVGRMLGLMGFYVRGLETIDGLEKSAVLLEKGAEPWSAQRLQSVFSSFPSKKDPGLVEEKRTNAVLRVGTDQSVYFKK